jgi:uncharacterized protein YfaS (alpha-2-macroglobulin family)
MKSRARVAAACLGLLLTVLSSACAGDATASAPKPTLSSAAVFKEIDRLIDEQKLEQAAKKTAALLESAKKAGDAETQTRALVKATQLRIALGGYETAVEFLKSEPWPEDRQQRAILSLFYAHALRTYQQAYWWEISQRERVVGDEVVDLKKWTARQIGDAAIAAYAEAYREREVLGGLPADAWPEFIAANNYPRSVRGTLRDAVSYLFVELLGDTALWSASQENELYRLDLDSLLGDDPSQAQLDVGDPARHPIARAVAVLADLEAWHRGRREREGELEARLERSRRLHDALSQDADLRRIREDLADRLERFAGLPWWAMGQATLADFVRGEDQPDALTQARELALAGERAAPANSPGALACRRIVAEIEAPSYQLTSMAADAPARRSIQVQHKNLAAIHLRAYRLDLAQRLQLRGRSLWPDWQEAEALVARRPDAEWRAELPATPDYREHSTYLEPPLTAGVWVVVASARPDFVEAGNHRLMVPIVVGDLVLAAASAPSAPLEFRALSGATGAPVASAAVTLYRYDWQSGAQQIAKGSTDAEGRVALPGSGQPYMPYFAVARHGGDVALIENVPGPGERLNQDDDAALVYTDRSIYRPQQKVQWKILAYRQKPGETPRTLRRTSVTVTLHDPNDEEVATQTVATNDYGTASGSFVIPGGRMLGGWSIETSLGGHAQVAVEEYKRPTFEVTLEDPKDALRLNQPASFAGEARYYFGLPVSSGTVRWQATRQEVIPLWWHWWGWSAKAGGGAQVVAAGETQLGADGRFTVAFTPQADERLAGEASGVTYLYEVHAEVSDEGGETREADRSFRLGFTSVEAAIELPRGFLEAGRNASATVTRRSLDGVARAGKGRWRLVELRQPEAPSLPSEVPVPAPPGEAPRFTTPGDRLRPRWAQVPPEQVLSLWQDGGDVARGEVTHGADGKASVALPELRAGAYRLRYETEDEFGALAKTQRELVVAGDGPLRLAAILEPESSTARVGDRLRVLAHGGWPGQPFAVQRYRDGRLIEDRPLTGDAAPQVLEFPVAPEDRGGFVLRLRLLRDHQWIEESRTIDVPWADRQLAVEFSSFRDKLRPGSRETWRVSVKGEDGAAVGQAELLGYMYDRSLDVFAPHRPARVLDLFPRRASLPQFSRSLNAAGAHYMRSSGWGELPPGPDLIGDRLIFLEGLGIGGMGMRMMAKVQGVEGGVPGGVVGGVAASAPAPQAVDALEVEESIAVTGEARADQSAEAAELRSEFSETAFWQPHLVTGADGTAALEFTVPDSVTSWNVWLHALTADLRSGSAQRQAQSVKELMVRPYLPRFLREGDRAAIKVVVNDAGEQPLSGQVEFDILDPETESSLLAEFGISAAQARQAFRVEPGQGATLSFPITAPKRVGQVAFKVTARAGDFSDGELRPLPLLPSRLHLAQSRFVALQGEDRRSMRFDDLARGDDPTLQNEQMVVTLDAQLFYGVLTAVPYLVDYPYECTEQTLNRFLSTAILASLFDRYPAVARMAQEMASRETQFETWDAADPNRKMALEETPWLREARGGAASEHDLIKVLDPGISRATRNTALAKLEEAQLPSGAFPWWPGGPPSDFMTLYLLYGFAKAGEFEVEVPEQMVREGWQYLGGRYREEWQREIGKKDGCCLEMLTFLNFIASSYPDPEWMGEALGLDDRKRILDWSFAHWKELSPYLKGMLALTLQRMERPQNAKLVFDSIMDSAKTSPDLGTYWAPEDRSWLWYNDTLESHAFALRTMTELAPQDTRRAGLVQWLFLEKKLEHWKSTRATAEVIYSLARYLEQEKQLGNRQEAIVRLAGQETRLVFEPDRYTGGKNQIVVPGEKLSPQSAEITVETPTKGMMFASATWHFSTEKLPAEARGDLFHVERRYFRRARGADETALEPIAAATRLAPGDEIEVQLSIRAAAAAEYVHLRDPRPAGLEPGVATSGWRWDLGLSYYEEVRDSGQNFFFEWLPAGEYTLRYRLRANLAGEFRSGPATLQSMYAPEFTAYSTGEMLRVEGK